VENLDAANNGGNSCRPASPIAQSGFPACSALGRSQDADGDGFTNEAERHIGTNPLAPCGPGVDSCPSDAWPLDLASGGVPNSTDRINLSDLTSFLVIRRLNTAPGDPNFNVGRDLIPGNNVGADWIVIGDLTAPFSGIPGNPPMNNGVKIFGAPFICSFHPVFGD
jgi:hypothetical protein